MIVVEYDPTIYKVHVDSVNGLDLVMEDHDIYEDYEKPKTYKAINLRTGRKCRVKINHDITGTATTGMGDTYVRVVA